MFIDVDILYHNSRFANAFHTCFRTYFIDLLDHLEQTDDLSFRLPLLEVMQFDRLCFCQNMCITARQLSDVFHIDIVRLQFHVLLCMNINCRAIS